MKKIRRINLSLNYGPNKLALFAFLLLFIITQSIAYHIYKIEKTNQFREAKDEANHIKNQLNSALNYSINAAKILSFIVEKDLYEENFDTVSKDLLAKNKFIDALQLVQGTTIIKTYPLKDNEKTIGYDIQTNPEHRFAMQQAIKYNKLYFEGPINLIQGGKGIIGREPIYKNNKLWGYSVVLIKLKTLLKALEMDSKGQNKRFTYQITKTHKKNSELKTFFNNRIDLKKDIYHKTYLSSGEWHLYVKLKNPTHYARALEFSLLGFILCFTIALFIRYLAEQPIVLKKLVAEKTKDLENINQLLDTRVQELASVNKELEYFAYIISHDLQEPLRMITNFLSQLEKKYNDILDEKGKKYIFFAVDGAKRMKNIILDILEFSRAGKNNESTEKIEITEIIKEIIAYNKTIIEEQNIQIEYNNLPTIESYKSPILQIFQNLIGNSIKYAREDIPTIIKVSEFNAGEKLWGFAIQDNGMGIEEAYFEKIFILFQRIHTHEKNSGSGMGLAIVKKIVENLGGTIWVESKINEGTTFYFTIAKK